MSASDNNARAIPVPTNLLKHKGSARTFSETPASMSHRSIDHSLQCLSRLLRERRWPKELESHSVLQRIVGL